MANISLWSPWGLIPKFRDVWDDEFDLDFSEFPKNEMDMYEEGDNIIVKVKAPGFKEKNIDISIEDNTLTITGKEESEEKEENKKRKYFRKEFRSQSFTRKIDLPYKVQTDKVKAELENGIIKVTLPKSEDVKPKQIKISLSK